MHFDDCSMCMRHSIKACPSLLKPASTELKGVTHSSSLTLIRKNKQETKQGNN